MHIPISRYTFFLRKVFSRVPTLALVVFFVVLVFGTSKAFAVYDNYMNLFNGTTPPPALTITKKASLISGSTTNYQTDLQFNLLGSFNLDNPAAGSNPRDWYWAHIKDFGNDDDYSDHTFIIRFCDQNTGETDCVFSDIPAKSRIRTDYALFSCQSPDSNCQYPQQEKPKIYHYSENIGFSGSEQYSNFNVLFNVTRVAPITSGGEFGTEIPTTTKFPVGDTKTYTVDAWYCGDSMSGETLPDTEVNANVRFFNNLCGGHKPYFRMTPQTTLTMPSSAAAVATDPVASVSTANTDHVADSGLPSCGAIGIGGTVLGCVARVVYYVIYWPISWFAGVMGNLFDFFMGYSLSDASYRAEFAVAGWRLIRNISNIFFILILVWTGLSAVFNTQKSNMKRVVTQLIFNALLINFSLFGTRVVIDLSNVVARVFYHSVQVCQGKCVDADNDGVNDNPLTIGGYKSISAKIVGSFEPQKIFAAQTLVGSSQAGNAQNTKGFDPNDNAGYYIIVTLFAAVIMFSVAMMFWNVAFMFLGRVIGLYLSMIFAPFAVLTRGGMPLVSGLKELSWSTWTEELFKYATLAPIFLFFLYIISSFLDTGFLSLSLLDSGNPSFFTKVISIAVPMLIVYVMMQQGVSIARKYAGTIGNGVQKLAMGVTGAAVGVAAGGAAFIGRNAIGRGLGWFGSGGKQTEIIDGKEVETTRAQRWAANANNSWRARIWNNTYSKTQTGSWDARNVGGWAGKAGGMLGGSLGLKDTFSGSLGLGADKALGKKGEPGGNVAIDKKRAEKRAEKVANRMKTNHLTDDGAKIAADRYKHQEATKAANKSWEENLKNEQDAEKVAKNSQAFIKLKAKQEELEQDLARAKASKSVAAETVAEQALAQSKAAQEKIITKAKDDQQNDKKAFQNMRLQAIDDLKKDEQLLHQSGIYKEFYDKKQEELRKYKVKDAKSFGAMMRAEYAESYKKQSFFRRMLDEVTDGSNIGATLVGGTVAAIFPMLAPAVGAALTSVFTQAITGTPFGKLDGKSHSSINSRALGKLIKDATTKTGKGDVLVDMEARLEKHKDMLAEALGLGSYEDVAKLADDKLEELILQKQAALEVQRDLHDEAIKTAKAAKDTVAQEKAILAKKKVERELYKLNTTPDKIYDLQEKIDRHKTQAKWNDENKKKGDGDGGKPDKDKSK